MRKIIYVTGGQRSGKSRFSQDLALKLSPNPVYLATARHWDAEFDKRIARHQADRGENWINIEEEKSISLHKFNNNVVLLDCITLWLTNIYTDNNFKMEESLVEAKSEWERFINNDFILIVVSNEIGMGVIPAQENTRAFADLQGFMNQFIAKLADEVFVMFSGLPLKLK